MDSTEDHVIDKPNKNSKTESEDNSASEAKYELINNAYYYTDKSTGKRMMYNKEKEEWEEVSIKDSNESVTVDEEGRQYYYADDMYLCRDTTGNVFYMDHNSEWKSWYSEEKETTKKNEHWYFYQGQDTFYRDNSTGKIYKLNKESNEWCLYEGKLKGRKRTKIDDEEEFDTDEEEEMEEDDDEDGSRPPGYQIDPSISYDGSMYIKQDPKDGALYEWDINRRAWFPKIDEDFMATYQLSYGFNPDGTKNENPLKFDDEEEKQPEPPKPKETKPEKKKASWFEIDDAHNTKVYVSNLPEEMSEDEFVDLMQKCGLVQKDSEMNKFKVKMYKDTEGRFKGDALCTYIRVESVDLALQILDGYPVGNKSLSVERAKFTQKGDYNPSLKPKKKRKKELEKLQKKQEKLFDWRPEPMRGQRAKHENAAIIKNAFTPNEFEKDASKLLTHQEALRAQCESFGAVKKLELFDRHPEGVVKVTFVEVEAADMCVATLNNRLYCTRRLSLTTWNGKDSFKIEESEEEKQKRLKKWDEFLEKGANTEKKIK